MKKFKVKIIRIIAFIMVIALCVGIFLPAVAHADEVVDNTMPTEQLPMGFEYVKDGNFWTIKRTDGNTDPAIYLSGRTEEFDAQAVTMFVGNLETNEVSYYTMLSVNGYITAMDLSEGYYVLYSGNYAWSDSSGNSYAINDGQPLYFYVGENYDAEKYEEDFLLTNDEIINLSLGSALENMQTVKYNESLTIDVKKLKIPTEYKIEPIKTDENSSENPTTTTDPEINNESTSIIVILLKGLKGSAFWLILLAGCWIGLQVIKIKKQRKLEEQTDIDKLDDKKIN